MSKLIYLDNAATTKTAPEVLEAMLPYFTEQYGNPSAIYSFASHNKDVVAEQRERIANALGAKSNEILQPADQSLTTGHSKQPLRLIRIKENILSQPRSNIMRSCIQQLIWKSVGLK